MKLKFDRGYTPPGDARDRPTYEAGKTYDFSGAVALTYAKKYIERGLAHEVGAPDVATVEQARSDQAQLNLQEAERNAEEAAKLAARSAVDIPDDIDRLHWRDLQKLASQLTDDPVRSKEDAVAAINAERGRRAIAA